MTQTRSKMAVGFIGLGIMGQHMAARIMAAGYALSVYNRSPEKAAALVAAGAVAADSPGAVSQASDVVITMVGYPADVEEIYLSKDGIVASAQSGAILIDMTTSSPDLAARIAAQAAARGLAALDAPVTGGDVAARDGTLAIMVGGGDDAFEAALPVLERMGDRIVHLGGHGAGQHAKMANQIAIASTMLGVCESLIYAKAAGLDADRVLDAIGKGAASSFLLNGLGRKILQGDYSAGFFVHHFVKDMSIALIEAERMGLDLPGLALARRQYQRLVDAGHSQDGTQALFRVYDAPAPGAGG